ncbi:hypothetical protein VC83_06707 [Pseudogymnoascus destructans]|uniref:Uncharacterized protein n=1 Tax=Pseudogymnoascus destructans TaxID=655981 RepID=A0A177A452_9PEZI|nr:uncharacterized protein VC83_06707 [Pseudogymnoascus destructans]OAF56380.1 hypothetical protein VC83_06707 [Pseudogymnoascus destructans]
MHTAFVVEVLEFPVFSFHIIVQATFLYKMNSKPPLQNKQQLPNRTPPLQLPLRLRNILKLIPSMHLHPHLPIRNKPKQLPRIRLELLPRLNIRTQPRPQHLNILRSQPRNRKRWDRSTRIAKANKRPLPRHRRETALECRSTNTIKDSCHTSAVGDPLHLSHKIMRLIIHQLIRSILLRQRQFLSRRSSSDNLRPNRTEELAKPQPHTTSSSVHQNRLPLLNRVRLPNQRQSRKTLKQTRSSQPRLNPLWELKRRLRRHSNVLRVRPPCRRERSDAVTDLEAVGVSLSGHGDDSPLCFLPEDSRGGGRVQAGAEVGVDVVYACEGVFDEDLARGGGGEGEVGV